MDYRILQGSREELQRKFNQWANIYYINILGVTYDNNSSVVIVLSRTKK